MSLEISYLKLDEEICDEDISTLIPLTKPVELPDDYIDAFTEEDLKDNSNYGYLYVWNWNLKKE